MAPYKNDTWQILRLKQTNMTPIKNGALQQWHTLCCAKRCPKDIFAKDNWDGWFLKANSWICRMIRLMVMGFQSQVFYTSEWHSYYSPVSNCRGRFYWQCVGSTSENQQCSCEMPLFILGSILQGGIFDKRSALFVTLCQWLPFCHLAILAK